MICLFAKAVYYTGILERLIYGKTYKGLFLEPSSNAKALGKSPPTYMQSTFLQSWIPGEFFFKSDTLSQVESYNKPKIFCLLQSTMLISMTDERKD